MEEPPLGNQLTGGSSALGVPLPGGQTPRPSGVVQSLLPIL